jgi:hypothetical protein
MLGELSRLPSRVVYVRERSGRSWHISIAKNVAHRVAKGAILVNLDCDNYVSDAIEVIRRYFRTGCRLLHLWSGVHGDGTYGRIALLKSLFRQLGGYDESFLPMGYQDTDLLHRAVAIGVPLIHYRSPREVALKNSKAESIRHCKLPGWSYDNYVWANQLRSVQNIAAGHLVANLLHHEPLEAETFVGRESEGANQPRLPCSPGH